MTRPTVALVVLAVACAGASDDDTSDTTDSDAVADETSIVAAFCAAGGVSITGDRVHVACFAPGDPATAVVTGQGLVWEPGPIVRLQPAEE